MTASASHRVWTLSEPAALALSCLHQHRLLSTGQLHVLLGPGRGVRGTQRLLAALAARDLTGWVRERGGKRGRERVWHLTPAGAKIVDPGSTGEPRRKPITPEAAAGPLQRHTLAVNQACLAFLQAARERGDDCGPLAWRHEVAHPIGPKRPDVVIPDAVLRYLTTSPDDGGLVIDYRFLELDRATVPVDQLAAKLTRYTRLATYQRPNTDQPAWREQYLALPDLLVVLAGATRRRLDLRTRHLVSLCGQTPGLGRDPLLRTSICQLADLEDQGPYAAIFTRLDRPGQRCDWLGNSGMKARA